MKFKAFLFAGIWFVMFFLYSCSTTVNYNIKPINLEPPKQITQTQIPYHATIIVQDRTLDYTHYDFDIISVNTKYILPTKSMVVQGVKYYLAPYFKKSDYSRNNLELYGNNHIIVEILPYYLYVKENLGFSKKSVDVEVYIESRVYDDNYIVLRPITAVDLKGTYEVTGVFSTFGNEGYAKAAAMSIEKDLQQIGQKIVYALTNQNETINIVNSAIEKEPLELDNYFILANVSIRNGNYKDAISASKMIIKLKPDNIAGYDLLARSYYKNAQGGLAKKVFTDAISQNIKEAKEYYIKFLVDTKDYNTAIMILKQNQIPINDKTLIEVLFGVNEYQLAINILKKALVKQQYKGVGIAFSDILSNSGYPIVESVNPLSSAVDLVYKDDEITEINNQSTKNMEIEKVIGLIKKEPNALNDIVIKRKNAADLIKLSIKTQELNTIEAFSIYAWMAFGNYFLNNKKDFYEYADLSYKLYPEGNVSGIAKALALIDNGNYDKAINLLDNIDFLAEAGILKAIAYAKKKDYNKALLMYKTAQQNNGSVLSDKFKFTFFEAVSSFVSDNLSMALQLKNQGDYKKALEHYQMVLDIVGDQKKSQIYSDVSSIIASNPSVVELDQDSKKSFIYGQMYYQENKLDKAIAQLNTVIEKNPFNPNLHHDIALLYAQTQDYKKAIEHMNIYLTLLPNASDAQAVRDEIIKWEFKLKGE